MLPPGHIAGGFLTAEVLLKTTHQVFSQTQKDQLLLWGMFFGFAPDLDFFYALFKEHAWVIRDQHKNSHRKFFSHAPVLWLIAGLLIYFLASSPYVKFIGLLLWLGSWSHFFLDSIEYGVMWLWPLTDKKFAFRKMLPPTIEEPRFFAYWWKSVGFYSKTISFYLEILIIVSALIVFFK